jgi:3-phenylpropionate/cinnamic acid dioxygenase small subunit
VDRIAAIEDKLAIQELLNRYATMVDGRRWKLMDEVFAPGATIDYRSTGGRAGPYRAMLEWLDRALEPWPVNLHFISNVSIELAGDAAYSRCYFHAPMGKARGAGSQLVITNAGYYDDELVRTPEGWRIAKRHCEQTVMIGQLPEGYEIPD